MSHANSKYQNASRSLSITANKVEFSSLETSNLRIFSRRASDHFFECDTREHNRSTNLQPPDPHGQQELENEGAEGPQRPTRSVNEGHGDHQRPPHRRVEQARVEFVLDADSH